MRTITFRISRTGIVPAGAPAPAEYAPWAGAVLRFARHGGAYAPGVVLPRDVVIAQAGPTGEGAVQLQPGRYQVTLPSGEAMAFTLSEGDAEWDLSALLAGGVAPTYPRYPTLLAHVDSRLDAETAGAITAAVSAGEARVDALIARGDAVTERAERAAADASTSAQEARDAALPLAAERAAAEAAMQGAQTAQATAEARSIEAAGSAQAAGISATTAAQYADGDTVVATLAELASIEPRAGRRRYVAEIKRPAWGDGAVWRIAQGWLANLGDTAIERVVFDEAPGTADAHLNVYPDTL